MRARRDDECPVCGEPTQTASGELTGNPHSPDCEYLKPQYIPPAELPDYFKLPGMEHKRMDLMDWRFNGIEARLGTLESAASAFRLTALEERLSALEDWADIEYAPVDGNPPDCIHELIAEGMNLVTTHCMESAAALVTVATAATDKRADAICKQAELLQNLLASTKALLLNVDARLEALENRAPC